ncbi:MAG TPA: heme ABC transporter ATP-binding protein [Pseudomonadales bacterium]|nr:heme ABC transporter ATP-binding protein [Pseudomonadales bacterium]HNL92641.1 heme ABC transporter ATP-binding protein [Pseudomonadales bacterium]
MTSDTFLAVEQLHFSRHEKTVLEIPAWHTAAGQLVGVLGPNGAGKSTLLKLLAGEWRSTGNIIFHGRRLQQWNKRELACHLAVLPQASRLSLPFTAREVVALGGIPLTINRKQLQVLVDEAMARTHASSLANALFTELSGGEQQRVQLARVLVQLAQAKLPPLLLLDEPISAQDMMQQHAIMHLAHHLAHKQGWGVLAVLHDINFAARYCDQLCILRDGKLAVDGAPQACLRPDVIEAVWRYRPTALQSETGAVFYF